MNFIDILTILVLLLFAVKGFLKGLVREVCSLLGLVMGSWAAFKYYPFLGSALRPYIHLPQAVATIVSFVLIFLAVGILFLLLGHLLTAVFKIAMLGGINRIGGVAFGLLQGGLVLCILLYLGTTKPMPEKLKVKLGQSKGAAPLIACGREIVTGWESEVQLSGGAAARK
ncbi:MAG: CvpA family protein [Geobacter sp.]|nr:CvpA family protein [Geobacter sp.]